MIKVFSMSDVENLHGYPLSVVEKIISDVRNLDLAYGSNRTMDGDGGYDVIIETAEDLTALIASLPFGDVPENAELIDGYVYAVYIVSNDRTIGAIVPAKLATTAMKSQLYGGE